DFVREAARLLESLRREQERVLRVDVPDAAARLEHGDAGRHDDVLDEEWPPPQPETVVEADIVADAPAELNELERLRVVEAEVVDVEDRLERRQDIGVGADPEEEEAGIDE